MGGDDGNPGGDPAQPRKLVQLRRRKDVKLGRCPLSCANAAATFPDGWGTGSERVPSGHHPAARVGPVSRHTLVSPPPPLLPPSQQFPRASGRLACQDPSLPTGLGARARAPGPWGGSLQPAPAPVGGARRRRAAPASATRRASRAALQHPRPACCRRTSAPRCPSSLRERSVRPSAGPEPRRLALLTRVPAASRHGAGRGQRAPQPPGPRGPSAAPGPRALGRRPRPGPAELPSARAAQARRGAAAADQRERPIQRRAGGSRLTRKQHSTQTSRSPELPKEGVVGLLVLHYCHPGPGGGCL
ncbi:transmembrane protein 163 isoform X3 [Acinonyx jubatus]|nr:transmembrane protein 163 isoform X3 [Acinonyx jubatus]